MEVPGGLLAAAEVQAARERQRARYHNACAANAHLDARHVRQHCTLNPGAKLLLERALEHLGLSARAYDKVLRVARTIADLDNADAIAEHHLAEAVQYRSLDKDILHGHGGPLT